MELLQLRYFFESAKTQSFARTAEKFMVPTTSVSASVRRLEEELGCRLFDRTCNRIRLNANGKRLQSSLCLVFDELSGAIESLSATASDEREIKMLVRAVRSHVTERIAKYAQKHPQIAFQTVFDFGEKALEKYDIVIDRKAPAYAAYESFELCTMRLRLLVAATDPLCGTPLTLRRLCDRPFISWGEQSNMHRILLDACQRAGFSPNIAVEINDKACYERLIAAGVGIGLSREEKSAPPLGCAYLDVKDFDERYTVYCYYKRPAYYGNVKHFIDFLRKEG